MAAQGESNRWLLKNTCSAELIEIRKSEETSVGRHREARVCLRSGKVSRFHACLGLTEDGKLWLKDLKSSNGTYVNETRIEACKLELVQHGAKLGFGLPSINGVEEEKDDFVFWEVLQLTENDDDKAPSSLDGIEESHNQISAVVQNGGTFEFSSIKDEIIEISDEEDIEGNYEKSKNAKVINTVNGPEIQSFEPQPGTSISEIEKILESFDDDITKVIRKSNIETENNSVNENNSNEKASKHVCSEDSHSNQIESKKNEDKKEKDADSDISDDDLSSSQIFQMSRLPDPVDFQKIKNEMAEMNYTDDPMILNPIPLDIDDGFDNTQEILDILGNDFVDTSPFALPDPPPAECSTSINLKPAEPPIASLPRKSSRLEAREPGDTISRALSRRKSCLDSPKKKKLETDLNSSRAGTTKRKLKRRHSSTTEVAKVETPDLEKQMALICNNSNSSKRENVLKEPKRNNRRSTEGDKSKKPKLDKQLTSSPDKSNEKNVAKETKGKRKSSLGESKIDKASKEPKSKQRRSSVKADKNESPKPEEKLKSGTRDSIEKNVSQEPRRKLTPSIKINKVKKPELKKSLMTLRSNSDLIDGQKVSIQNHSTGSLANTNRDSSGNGPVDPRLHKIPTPNCKPFNTKNVSMEFNSAGSTANSNGHSSDNRHVDPRLDSLPKSKCDPFNRINQSVKLHSAASSAKGKADLPVATPAFRLPAPPCQLESPKEVLQENYKRRPDPRLATQMISKQTSSVEVSKVINERQTVGRVAGYKIAACNIDKIINKILKWDTSWLEYQLTAISFEPRVNETAAEKIPLKFRNFDQYLKIFNKLIFLETWESIFRCYIDSRRSQAKLQPIVQGIRKHECFTYVDCVYEITATQHQKGDYYKQDDLILVECNVIGLRNMTFGLVQSSRSIPNIKPSKFYAKINFTVMIPCDLLSKSNNAPLPRVIIQRVANLRTQIMMFKVLKNFEKSPLHSMLLCPRINDFKIGVTHEKIIVQPQPHKLNSQQERIVLEAASLCTGDKPGIYTLIGPPGTGKTHTIVNILFQIIFNHYFGKAKSKQSKPPMILLVAPSNAAVDNLITKIVSLKEKLHEDFKRKLKCVRIGPMTSISKAAKFYTLQHLAERHVPIIHQKLAAVQDARKRKIDVVEFCKEYFGKDYHKELRISENLLMENSNIILTTLGSCASNSKIIDAIRKRLIYPTCCIIDEATQCHEPESLLPTMLGIDKIVMVGDPQQLNATILSKEASKLGFGESLFNRLVNNFEKARESPVQMLTTQYRMHPEICSFPNRKFYQGKLQSQPHPKNKLPDIIKPYLVFNCTNQISQDDSDYTNPEEMRLIKKLLITIIQVVNNKKLSYSVGIITPYNAQKSLIHDNLTDIGNENSNWEININTVDSFQGSEHDIVIISCVRESTNSFVQNVNRLNVALTRAKQALYIFGNSTLFRECRPLYDLREDARGRKVCLDINSRSQSLKDFRQYLCRQ